MLKLPEEAHIIEDMHAFNNSHTGISWSAAVRSGDDVASELKFIPMQNRPCYGEMRAYGAGSTRPGDHKPGDLPRPIPKGVREAVSVYIGKTSTSAKNHNRFVRFCFSPESPWRRGIGFGGLELTHDGNEDHLIKGAVMYDTDVDPTVMVSLFMFLRSARNEYGEGSRVDAWAKLIDEDKKSELAALIASNWMSINLQQKTFQPSFGLSYFLPIKLDPKKFGAGEANNLSNGRTWRDGEDYNRPEIQDLFATFELPLFSDEIGRVVGVEPTNAWNTKQVSFDLLPKALDYIDRRLAA